MKLNTTAAIILALAAPAHATIIPDDTGTFPDCYKQGCNEEPPYVPTVPETPMKEPETFTPVDEPRHSKSSSNNNAGLIAGVIIGGIILYALTRDDEPRPITEQDCVADNKLDNC